jgi:ABC-type branched-subunit amino acid transport system permease subunit
MEHLLFLCSLVCVWIIVALAANLVIGYTGMMAMGQAAYLGLGAYVASALNVLLGVNYLVALVIAVIASGAVACGRSCVSAASTSRWRPSASTSSSSISSTISGRARKAAMDCTA